MPLRAEVGGVEGGRKGAYLIEKVLHCGITRQNLMIETIELAQ